MEPVLSIVWRAETCVFCQASFITASFWQWERGTETRENLEGSLLPGRCRCFYLFFCSPVKYIDPCLHPTLDRAVSQWVRGRLDRWAVEGIACEGPIEKGCRGTSCCRRGGESMLNVYRADRTDGDLTLLIAHLHTPLSDRTISRINIGVEPTAVYHSWHPVSIQFTHYLPLISTLFSTWIVNLEYMKHTVYPWSC